jgi:hypothetical protein
MFTGHMLRLRASNHPAGFLAKAMTGYPVTLPKCGRDACPANWNWDKLELRAEGGRP